MPVFNFAAPLLILATIATVIASQAVLTGAFSLAKQAIELGLLPRMRLRYTSSRNERHVYLPSVNLLLGIGTVAVVLTFRSSAALGGAYGLAVAGAMLGTTALFAADQLRTPSWPWSVFVVSVVVFFLVDLFFFSTNLFKLEEGGWLPLTIAIAISLVMLSWRSGQKTVAANQISLAENLGTCFHDAIITGSSGKSLSLCNCACANCIAALGFPVGAVACHPTGRQGLARRDPIWIFGAD